MVIGVRKIINQEKSWCNVKSEIPLTNMKRRVFWLRESINKHVVYTSCLTPSCSFIFLSPGLISDLNRLPRKYHSPRIHLQCRQKRPLVVNKTVNPDRDYIGAFPHNQDQNSRSTPPRLMEWLDRISLITWAVARYLMDLYQIKVVIPRAHLVKIPRTRRRPWRRFMHWTFQSIRTFQGTRCPIVWCEVVHPSHLRLLTHRHLQVRRWEQALVKALARNKCKCNHRLSVLLIHSL